MKEDEIICDKCDHYYTTPSGCGESCFKVRQDGMMFFTKGYFEDRLSGNKLTCKGFKKIFSFIKPIN